MKHSKPMIGNYLGPIHQLYDLLLQFDNAFYAKKLNMLNDTSIGAHTRHIITFYECLQKGIANGKVDYESRDRHPDVEQEVGIAQKHLRHIINTFETHSENQKLLLLVENAWVETSLWRELHYLSEHTVHHLAIIRIGLQESDTSIVFDKNLGVASSTIAYRERIAC